MNLTKRFLLVLTVCLTSSVLMAYAFGTVQYFTATYQGTDVKLEWRVDDDTNIDQFEISRKRPDETNFTRLNSVTSNGTGSYTFIDDKLYKSGQVATISYRLTSKSGTTNAVYYTSIANNPTAVQRTWGSIKSMFK